MPEDFCLFLLEIEFVEFLLFVDNPVINFIVFDIRNGP